MTTHRHPIKHLYAAVQYILGGRCVIVDQALIDSVVLINSRTGGYEIHGEPVDVGRGPDGEWIVNQHRKAVPA